MQPIFLFVRDHRGHDVELFRIRLLTEKDNPKSRFGAQASDGSFWVGRVMIVHKNEEFPHIKEKAEIWALCHPQLSAEEREQLRIQIESEFLRGPWLVSFQREAFWENPPDNVSFFHETYYLPVAEEADENDS